MNENIDKWTKNNTECMHVGLKLNVLNGSAQVMNSVSIVCVFVDK